jgi:hypothetical protein
MNSPVSYHTTIALVEPQERAYLQLCGGTTRYAALFFEYLLLPWIHEQRRRHVWGVPAVLSTCLRASSLFEYLPCVTQSSMPAGLAVARTVLLALHVTSLHCTRLLAGREIPFQAIAINNSRNATVGHRAQWEAVMINVTDIERSSW